MLVGTPIKCTTLMVRNALMIKEYILIWLCT